MRCRLWRRVGSGEWEFLPDIYAWASTKPVWLGGPVLSVSLLLCAVTPPLLLGALLWLLTR